MSSGDRRLRLELVAAGARLTAAGLVLSGEGNLSARLDAERCLVTPSGVDKGRMRALDIVEVGLDGDVLPAGASTETALHRELYRRFGRIGAVVHAHPYAVQRLAGERRLPDPRVLLEGPEIVGEVVWVDSLPPGSSELAVAVTHAMAAGAACVLHRHGAVTAADDLERAVRRMLVLERLARLTLAQRAG